MGKHIWELRETTVTTGTDAPTKTVAVESLVQEKGADANDRGQWGSKAEFVLSCISLSVGLGNVWRFPYLAYANGGGAFLIPYIFVLFLIGKPMYFMETSLGQYHSQGPVEIWKNIVPLAKGIGVGQVVASLLLSLFYVIIMAWTLFYLVSTLVSAFQGEPVPWSNFCDNEWAHKDSCIRPVVLNEYSDRNYVPLVSFENLESVNSQKILPASASQQYFDRYVLMRFDQQGEISHGLGNMGKINLPLLGCLAVTWLVVFLSVVKGIKSSGKVVYITSTMPFITLIILLGRGASLENALEGILYFIVPKFDRLLSVQTWKAAAEQLFLSLAIAYGPLTMLGSYNKFNNDCYQDALLVSILDSCTSVTAGLAMFSVLGFLAGQRGVGVENVVASGPGLAFVTYPEALNQMPVPHLWAILFFVMLYTLGLGSLIGLLETGFTFICDTFPTLRAKRAIIAAVGCGFFFTVDLAFVTQGGVDLFDIFNEYAGGISILLMAALELFFVMWVYGLKRFIANLQEMIGKKGNMSYYWRTAWLILGPITLLFILVVSLVQYKSLHESSNGRLPVSADGIGWMLTALSFIQVPIWALVVIFTRKDCNTFGKRLRQSIWPDHLLKKPVEEIQFIIPRPQLKASIHESLPPSYENLAYEKED